MNLPDAFAEQLAAPFGPAYLEWRIARCGVSNGNVWGRCLPYLTARAVMDRLDQVCGSDRWQTEYREVAAGVACGIGILVWDSDGTQILERGWVWKWDGTGHLEVTKGLDAASAGKGDFSNALKRAGVQWGIGRYLYAISEQKANIHKDGAFFGKTGDGTQFRWDPPNQPKAAVAQAPQASSNEHNAPQWVVGDDLVLHTEGGEWPDEVGGQRALARCLIKMFEVKARKKPEWTRLQHIYEANWTLLNTLPEEGVKVVITQAKAIGLKTPADIMAAAEKEGETEDG